MPAYSRVSEGSYRSGGVNALEGARRRRTGRRGVGIALALVVWVVAMALLFALVANQASTSAFSGMVRASYAESMLFAGLSALDEASYVLRHPRKQGETVFDTQGGQVGHFTPKVSQAVFSDPRNGGGLIRIDPVEARVWYKPSTPSGDWLIDLSVAVRLDLSSRLLKGFSRVVRRRYSGRMYQVYERLGPDDPVSHPDPNAPHGQAVYTDLMLGPEPVLEVVTGQ